MNDFERGMQYQQLLAHEHQRHVLRRDHLAVPPRDGVQLNIDERKKAMDAEIAKTRENMCRRHLARIQVYTRRIADLNELIHRAICDNRLNPHAHSAETLAAMKANMDRFLKQKDEEMRKLQELGGAKPKEKKKKEKENVSKTKKSEDLEKSWLSQGSLESHITDTRNRIQRQQALRDYDLQCSEARLRAMEEHIYQQQQLHFKLQDHHATVIDELGEKEKYQQAVARDHAMHMFSAVMPYPQSALPYCAETWPATLEYTRRYPLAPPPRNYYHAPPPPPYKVYYS